MMANITTLTPGRAQQRAKKVKALIKKRRNVLRLLGAKSTEGVQVVDGVPRSVIDG